MLVLQELLKDTPEIVQRTVSLCVYLYSWYFGFLIVSLFMRYDPGVKGDVPRSIRVRNFTLGHPERAWDKETLCELTYSFMNLVLFGALKVFCLIALQKHVLVPYLPVRIFQAEIAAMPVWIQVILALLILDFALYIRHRFVHEFCWPFHAVHHSAPRISWTTADRLHPIDNLIMGAINLVVLHVLGFRGEGMVYAVMIKQFLNYFNHSNIVLDYGFPLRYIFVSPNMHRWHHATTKDAINKNYCIIFSFYDVLFGTFYVPEGQVPSKYGSGYEPDKRFLAHPNYLDDFVYPFKMIAHNWRAKRAEKKKPG